MKIDSGDVWLTMDGMRFFVEGFENAGDTIVGSMFTIWGTLLPFRKVLAIELKDPARRMIVGGCWMSEDNQGFRVKIKVVQ